MFAFLSAETTLERTFYILPRFSATICGCWPRSERSWSVVFFFLFCFSQETMAAFGEFLYGCMNLNDLLEALAAFCPSFSKMCCVVKMSTLFIYHKEIFQMIGHIKTILLTASNNPDKRKIVQKWNSTGNTLSFILFIMGSLTSIGFALLPLMLNLWLKWHGKETVRRLPFLIYLPSASLEYPLYPFTYIEMAYSGVLTMASFTAVDGFFLCTCCYFSAAFCMLQYDIQQIFVELEFSDCASRAQSMRFRKQLKEIVVRHIELRELCAEFSSLFRFVLFSHFFLASLVLGLGMLELILNFPSPAIALYIVHNFAVLTQYFLYCSGGSFVSESSMSVADVLYNIEWYKCDPDTRKMILMILREAQNMKTIEIPFFTASLPAFNSLLAKTGSYVAMLKTFI